MKKSTVEIEEEDWIEYMKRSTAAAVDHIRIFKKSRADEMETSDAKSSIASREMGQESSGMEP